MSIAFTKDGKNYTLNMDGTVKADGTAYGTWTTDEDNALEITAKKDGSVFRQPARWSTTSNRLSVTPEGGEPTEFLDATKGDLQFRIVNNRLVVDPLPSDDKFSFVLTGDWSLADDLSALVLETEGQDTLTFVGGLHDSESRFVWAFDAENDDIKKRFNLRFDGTWKIKKRDDGPGVTAVFAFNYVVKGSTTKDSFELPVEVTADSANDNRLLFTYKRDGSATRWGVAFAGHFSTKRGRIIGYSAELYDDAGKISSRFTFDFKGRIKDGSEATRNSMKFELTIAGQTIEATLSGRFELKKSTLTFSFKLNTSSRTGAAVTISFGIKSTATDRRRVDLTLDIEGDKVTISLKVGADIKLGGSRKGSAYATLDMIVDGEIVGIDAMIGVTLN
jgi:hypothetical protein